MEWWRKTVALAVAGGSFILLMAHWLSKARDVVEAPDTARKIVASSLFCVGDLSVAA